MPSVTRILDPLGLWRRAGSAAADAAVALAETVVVGAVRRGLAERIAAELTAGGDVDRLVDGALASPATERLAGQVVDSRVVDAVVERLLAGEELWVLVDEIARSPSVTEAISHQGAGFAEQMAGEIGTRSRRADDRLDRAARRLLHRHPAP